MSDLRFESQRLGGVGGDPADRVFLGDREPGATTRGSRLGRFDIEEAPEHRNIGVHDDAPTGGIDEGPVFGDAIFRFALESPPIRPYDGAHLLLYQEWCDLVGLHRVMHRGEMHTEFLQSRDPVRDVIGSIAMYVNPQLASNGC